MLVQLSVHNLALLEELSLELHPGFNALTGETGAGKSMLIDAIGLVLGGRASPDLVRSGKKEAEVEALFDVEPNSRLSAKLEASGIAVERELVVRRVVHVEGRSRAFLNGRICTAAQLAGIAHELCDISSQHESVSLTDPQTHMGYLDAFGRLDGTRTSLAEQVEALAALERELEEARAAAKGRAEREDYLAFQLKEIDDVRATPGEEAELEIERARLKHAGRLSEATRRASDRLDAGETTLCDELARIVGELEAAAAVDGSLSEVARAVVAARAELVEAARALGRYADGVESNPSRLAEVEERMFRIERLLRKHGPTTMELAARRAELAAELEGLSQSEERIEGLATRHQALEADAMKCATLLSKRRRAAADQLAEAIFRELSQLGMGRARVVVDVAPGARLGATGMDRVEFLIAPNRGEEPRPLRRIASGGELSRALLALKRVLAEQGPAGLYVFDEVDAGVGGAIAEVIGRSIKDVARHRQVLCVTHLPQIAALADAHFVVGKHEAKGRTNTTVHRLGEKERVLEVARMIGGVRVGDAAKKAAAEMLAAS